ncbi:MAG: ATP synthase F0 subunit C [Candidatus Methylomirabilota bacterium]|nr:ATP synthase F0 subunit C [candidate division NC10 bacterium]PWB48633.1 MAG: ATP synthase F0 subunit C [candidate division NC10 bacterium]
MLIFGSQIALAVEGAAPESSSASGASNFFIVSVLTGGFAMAIASGAAAIGQSRAIVSALEAMGRQPAAAPKIQVAMIIGLALIESLAIYVLLVALIIFFANPFIKYVVPGA